MTYADIFQLEYALSKPRFLATCMYGIVFILLGNLSGNALELGKYLLLAAGKNDEDDSLAPSHHGSVIAIAIAALTLAILIHMASRGGGILLNNAFAIFKTSLLILIIALGFAYRGGANIDDDDSAAHQTGNFATKTSFIGSTKSLGSITLALLDILYSYSGFEQPFYVS
jgi:amino acid transporter